MADVIQTAAQAIENNKMKCITAARNLIEKDNGVQRTERSRLYGRNRADHKSSGRTH